MAQFIWNGSMGDLFQYTITSPGGSVSTKMCMHAWYQIGGKIPPFSMDLVSNLHIHWKDPLSPLIWYRACIHILVHTCVVVFKRSLLERERLRGADAQWSKRMANTSTNYNFFYMLGQSVLTSCEQINNLDIAVSSRSYRPRQTFG